MCCDWFVGGKVSLSSICFSSQIKTKPFHLIFQQRLTKEEVDQMLDEFLLECAKKEGGNENDIHFLKERNLPVSKEQDCMVACIGEGFELVSISGSN